MDAEDRRRLSKHLERLLAMLKAKGAMTNHEVRRVAGSRGMARVNELQGKGYPITVRKIGRSDWEVRFDAPPLARDAKQRVDQKSLF